MVKNFNLEDIDLDSQNSSTLRMIIIMQIQRIKRCW